MNNVTMDFINSLSREEVAQYVKFDECMSYTSSLKEQILILSILVFLLLLYNLYLTIKKKK